MPTAGDAILPWRGSPVELRPDRWSGPRPARRDACEGAETPGRHASRARRLMAREAACAATACPTRGRERATWGQGTRAKVKSAGDLSRGENDAFGTDLGTTARRRPSPLRALIRSAATPTGCRTCSPVAWPRFSVGLCGRGRRDAGFTIRAGVSPPGSAASGPPARSSPHARPPAETSHLPSGRTSSRRLRGRRRADQR